MELNASSFKAKCLRLLDLVNEDQIDIVITKRGKPVARLVAYEPREPMPLLGRLAGAGKTVEDITLPTQEEWDLES